MRGRETEGHCPDPSKGNSCSSGLPALRPNPIDVGWCAARGAAAAETEVSPCEERPGESITALLARLSRAAAVGTVRFAPERLERR
jgi:hypothetical protein